MLCLYALTAIGFIGLLTLPANFNYPWFAFWLVVLGVGQGLFAAPNTTVVMNSVLAEHRGVSSGMRATWCRRLRVSDEVSRAPLRDHANIAT